MLLDNLHMLHHFIQRETLFTEDTSYTQKKKNNAGQNALILHSEIYFPRNCSTMRHAILCDCLPLRETFPIHLSIDISTGKVRTTTSRYDIERPKYSRLLRALVIPGWRRDVSRSTYKHERRTPCTLIVHSIRGPSLTPRNFLPTDQSILSSASAVAESLISNLRDLRLLCIF